MRGARLHILATVLSLVSACAGRAAVPEPPPRPPDPPPLEEGRQEPQVPAVYRFPPAEAPAEPQVKGAPGGAGAVPAAADPPPKREEGDDEKLRTALLQAAAGKLEEAEKALSSLRVRSNRIIPYLELYLRRELGEQKEAGRLLGQFVEEERRVTGFAIGRAELCSRIHRFREFVPAESDRVKPGGTVLLYVEPRNFVLSRNQDRYILHLRYEWKLFDDRSVEVPVPAWEKASPGDREDRISLNGPVEEFYQSFKLPLPAALAAGHYRVKVTVTDVSSGKSDRVYVPIFVTGAEKER